MRRSAAERRILTLPPSGRSLRSSASRAGCRKGGGGRAGGKRAQEILARGGHSTLGEYVERELVTGRTLFRREHEGGCRREHAYPPPPPPPPLIRQRHINLLGQPSKNCVVQVRRQIRRTHDDNPVTVFGPRPVQLNHELGLEPATGLLLGGGPRAQDRVDLVDKNNRRLHPPRNREQGSHELLALSHPFGREAGRRHREEPKTTLGGDRFG